MLAASAALAAEEGRWKDARALAVRVATEFPKSDEAPAALATVATAAARASDWPVANETFKMLTDRYPTYKTERETRLDYAEALYRIGAYAEAKTRIQEFIDASPKDADLPRALLLLGRTQEASGDATGALEQYRRVENEFPAYQAAAALGNARVLMLSGNWDEARPLLERVMTTGDAPLASEAAYRLGDGYRTAGRHQPAVEAYMTAVYVAPDLPTARRALLGAGQSFSALKQNDSAVIVYKKLLASKTLEPELADAAKKNLKALGVN
jgi:TolA-binding protein